MSHALRWIGRRADSRKSSGFGYAVVIALTLMVPGTTLAQQEEDDPPGVVCLVSGYDVIIYNKGLDPIASGRRVDWSVPFLRKKGSHVLDAALEPEDRVFLSGVLGGGGFLDPSQSCAASLDEGGQGL